MMAACPFPSPIADQESNVFFEPERTPYDLNWRMLGTWVRIHPMFWLFSAILGWPAMKLGFEFLLLWIACVFVSILIHEFGHILVGRLFGSAGHIVLYSFGGLAIGSNALPNRWQRILVSLAGPFAGFLFLGLVLMGARLLDNPHPSPLVKVGLHDLLWINLGWGILNLLPIWPLDGGQVSRDLFEGILPGRGVKVALAVSALVAAFLAVHALLMTMDRPIPFLEDVPFLRDLQGGYTVLLFAILAFNSYQRLQFEASRRPWDDDGDAWKR